MQRLGRLGRLACVALFATSGVGACRGQRAAVLPEAVRLSVVTEAAGFDTLDVANVVTRALEDALAGVPDVAGLDSASTAGRSLVEVRMKPGVDRDRAAEALRTKLASVVGALPPGTLPPIISVVDGSAPFLRFAAVSPERTRSETTRIAEAARDALETATGVSHVTLEGGAHDEIEVRVSGDSTRAHNVAVASVVSILHGSVLKNAADVAGVELVKVPVPLHVADIAAVANESVANGPGGIPTLTLFHAPTTSLAVAERNALDKLAALTLPPGASLKRVAFDDRPTAVAIYSGPDADALRAAAVDGTRRAASAGLQPVPAPAAEPQRRVVVDADRAAAAGVTAAQVAETVRTALAGTIAAHLEGGSNVPVRVSQPIDEHAPLIEQLLVMTPAGSLIPLSAVASERAEAVPNVVMRRDRGGALAMCARAASGSLEDAVRTLQGALAPAPLPVGVHVVVEPVLPSSVSAILCAPNGAPSIAPSIAAARNP